MHETSLGLQRLLSFIQVAFVALGCVVAPAFLFLPGGVFIEHGFRLLIIDEYTKFSVLLAGGGAIIGISLAGAVVTRRLPVPPKPVLVGGGLLLAGMALAMTQSVSPAHALLSGAEVYLIPLLLFAAFSAIPITPNRGLFLIALLAIPGLDIVMIGLGQAVGWEQVSGLPNRGAGGSLLYNRNLAGEYVLLLVPLCMAVCLCPLALIYRVLAGVLTVLFTLLLVITIARGAWVGLLAGLPLAVLTMLVAARKYAAEKLLKKVVWPASQFMLVVALFLILILTAGKWSKFATAPSTQLGGERIAYEMRSISDPARSSGRLEFWRDALHMIGERGLLGVGAGGYTVHFPAYINASAEGSTRWDPRNARFRFPFRAHNDYLQLWAELGILGLAGFMVIVAAVFAAAAKGARRALQNNDRMLFLLILACHASFCAFLVSMFFGFPLQMPATSLTGWLMAGMVIALSRPSDCRVTLPLDKRLTVPLLTLALATAGAGLFAGSQVLRSTIYVNQADRALTRGDYRQARRWYETSLNAIPWNDRASVGKIKAEFELGAPDAALATADESLRYLPNSVPVRWLRISALRRAGHAAQSRQALREFEQRFPYLRE